MTNMTDAEDLLNTAAEGEGEEGTGDEPAPEDGQTQDGAGDKQATDDGQVENNADDAADKAPQKTADPALQNLRDQYSRVRNDQVTSYRILKALEDEGTYTRAEMAEKAGLDVGEVNRLLDNKPTAAPGEPEYEQTLIAAFADDIKNPVVVKALERAYGGKEALKELKAAYEWAHRNDPAVQANLANVSPEEMTVHVFDTGKEFLEEYREAAGRTPLQMLRASKAGQATTKANDAGKPEPQARQPQKAETTMPTLAERASTTRSQTPQDAWMARLIQ